MLFLMRERLVDLRKERNWDQDKVGEKINMSGSGYGYYEQGRSEPPLHILIKIAKLFNVSTDYLLGLSNTRENPVHYSINDKISLTAEELEVIIQMKELQLLEELSDAPEVNVEKLNRYWHFIKNEQNTH